jgi:hypothetical protein
MQLAEKQGYVEQPMPKIHVVTEEPLRSEILAFLGKRRQRVDKRGVEYFTLRLDNRAINDAADDA